MAWQNNPQPPPPPVPPQQPATAPSRAKGCLSSLVSLGVVIALGFGASQLFKDDDTGTSSSSTGATDSADDQKSRSWEKGDCGGPDPEKGSDSYTMFDCDESGATFKALEIMDGSIMPESIQCPAGTDLIIEVSISYGGSDAAGGIPSETVCGRNLSDDHPGDAGAGGGQLVEGDCVDNQAQEIACSGAGGTDYKVLGLVKTKDKCPAGTTEPMELMFAIGRPYDVICGGKA
ncbi:hypothetical protein [Streptomyces abyssomicinicus]|uniref:hypothetical protein n=1 Tax=Streptomyces abyssomicinicus TaxID=574929 RepID=UPI00350E57CE